VGGSCFTQALRASQRCSNPRVQVTPLLGFSGLGSELEWLLSALLYSLMHGRRLVHLDPHALIPHSSTHSPTHSQALFSQTLQWKYSCPEQRGWACFLAVDQCADSFVTQLDESLLRGSHSSAAGSILLRKGRKDFAFMNSNNAWFRHAVFQYAWSGQHYNESLSGELAMNEQRPPPDAPKAAQLQEMYDQVRQPNETLLYRYRSQGDLTDDCDTSTLVEEMEVIATRYLYRLNSKTLKAVEALNRELHPRLIRPSPLGAGYNSLQIRLTDKWKEMSTETWKWVTNTSNIAEFIRPFMTDDSHSDLFVATDACETVHELRKLLPLNIEIHSSCNVQLASPPAAVVGADAENNETNNRFGTQRDYAGALKLLADVEMLRNGRHFFGLAESNVVRLARRLQPPGATFHALGPQTS
jgi:hypothetical protein